MTNFLEPLEIQSVKDVCVSRLEVLILSGELQIGARLPPERQLAARLNISRPVVHEALVDLAAKGLISILPRRGSFVNDYRLTGSCALLSSLVAYQNGALAEPLKQSLIETRLLIETETARLAALHRSAEHIHQLKEIITSEPLLTECDDEILTERDFSFHLLIAIASGNFMYPLIINSFKPVYTNLTLQFFHKNRRTEVVQEVFDFHRRLVKAIQKQNHTQAVEIISAMLVHGSKHL